MLILQYTNAPTALLSHLLEALGRKRSKALKFLVVCVADYELVAHACNKISSESYMSSSFRHWEGLWKYKIKGRAILLHLISYNVLQTKYVIQINFTVEKIFIFSLFSIAFINEVQQHRSGAVVSIMKRDVSI